MEVVLGLYGDNGKEHGNQIMGYLGLNPKPLTVWQDFGNIRSLARWRRAGHRKMLFRV